MSLSIIVLLPVLVGFGLLYWSSLLSEDYELLGMVFQLMFLPLSLLSIQFGIIDATIIYASDSVLVEQLGMFAYYLGWLIYGVGAFILMVIVLKVKDMLLAKRAAKQEEKYG